MLKLRSRLRGSALIFGSAIDEALNLLLTNHFGGKNEGSPEEILLSMLTKAEVNGSLEDLSKSEEIRWSKSDNDQSVWLPEDFKSKERPEIVTLKRKGLMMLEAYRDQVLPHFLELIASQKRIEIVNQDGDKIVGLIDFIGRFSPKGELKEKYGQWDNKILVMDNKTSSITYDVDSVINSKQLATYSQVPEIECDGCGYIVIPKKFRSKKLPKVPISIIIDSPSDNVIQSTFEEYEQTLRGVKLGDFPCTRNCLKSPFGCDYKKYCESNGTNTEGLIYVSSKDEKSKKPKAQGVGE
jgi:hypothetical protein